MKWDEARSELVRAMPEDLAKLFRPLVAKEPYEIQAELAGTDVERAVRALREASLTTGLVAAAEMRDMHLSAGFLEYGCAFDELLMTLRAEYHRRREREADENPLRRPWPAPALEEAAVIEASPDLVPAGAARFLRAAAEFIPAEITPAELAPAGTLGRRLAGMDYRELSVLLFALAHACSYQEEVDEELSAEALRRCIDSVSTEMDNRSAGRPT